MQGTLGILGIAPFDDRADVFMLNGNHGRCFLLTSDGLYLDEMFRDVRVSYLNDAYRLGGEIFGGTFDRADGKYYTQIGHGPYRIYEVTGIAEAKRIEGKVTVSESQVNAAEHKITISTLSEPAKIDGNLNDWPKQPTLTWDQNGKFRVSLHTGFDDENLYLGYQVQDASPWINNGRDWTTLFATGDTVDLQIGTNPKADPNRNQPVVGDKRLMVAPYEGKPIAVLFEHRKPGGKNPIEFTSPWRGEKVDDVRQLAETEVAVKTAGSSYIVEARIPLSELGLRVEPGQPYRADFGVTFGDPEGRETQLRCYWANPATMLVDDIPGEIMLHPKLWGEIAVE